MRVSVFGFISTCLLFSWRLSRTSTLDENVEDEKEADAEADADGRIGEFRSMKDVTDHNHFLRLTLAPGATFFSVAFMPATRSASVDQDGSESRHRR